ncbi:hypothetical protein STCU_05599 [Strigomonas culicis]|nr:hypothetical protein STCU_05599 [Strigomonas culicis]|eukprot:EPY27739.1 hypothetical protein STCU_05599 [Strigomonas culicis]
MTDDAKTKLAEAKKAFESGKFSEAEKIFLTFPKDDLMVQHNLAIVQYAKQDIDSGKALELLGATEKPLYKEGKQKGLPLVFLYEGYDTCIYNSAVIRALRGEVAAAAQLLRSLLEISKDVSQAVLLHTLCLFQVLTRPTCCLGNIARSKADEDLIQSVLNENPGLTKDPQHLAMVSAAFADSGNLHEVFKRQDGTPAEEAAYLNNLGVFLLNDGKINVATLCFAKARVAASKDTKESLLQCPLTYNAALCALLHEDYDEAIRHLLLLQDTLRASPLFWLRFAEAAVHSAQHESQLRRRGEYEKQQSTFSQQLRAGKLYVNFELLQLPGATVVPGPAQETPKDYAPLAAMEQLAAGALQNALFLLIPQGYSYMTALESFPHHSALLAHAMGCWIALELMRRNYNVVVDLGRQVLAGHGIAAIAAPLHVSVLCYTVEALMHLGDVEQALKVLRQASLSSLVLGGGDRVDPAHRSRVEALFINLAVTHILSGSWTQAHAVMESLLAKIYEGA